MATILCMFLHLLLLFVNTSSLIVLQFLASGTMLCFRRGTCCGAKKKYVFENHVFIGKLSFGKPRLTHICGTLGSRAPFPLTVKTFYS